MVTTPVAAAELPVSSQRSDYAQSGYASAQDKAERYRRWRDRDRVDAGDVLAGIVIIGGIAAIASAIDSNNQRERYEQPRYEPNDYPRYDQPRRYQSGNLDQAVNACTRAIERDVRVESVESVSRIGAGWEVRGRLYDGSGFACSVSGEGRIDRIDYDGGGYQGSADGNGSEAYGAADYGDSGYGAADDAAPGQWSDDAYARARGAQGGAYPPPAEPEGAEPAYPGGPLPGEDIDGDLGY